MRPRPTGACLRVNHLARGLIMLRLRLEALAPALLLVAALPAGAQGLSSGGVASKGFSPPVQGVGPKQTQREAPPPGLPGAQSQPSSAPSDVPLDVPPTEALFEAINRGDMNMARDSLNRGADINGRNVLGMTPLDLSIDLSRNDITFLLLSLRGQATVSGPPSAVAAPAPGTAASRAAKKTLAEARVTARRSTTAAARPAGEAASPGSSVRYASVPSTPVPQAGFLGFGPTSTPPTSTP